MRTTRTETAKRSVKSVTSILLETVRFGLYRKLNSYELQLYDTGEPLRIELFRHVREEELFRARVYKTVFLDAPSSRRKSIRVEYAMLSCGLNSFPARTEDEAFAHVIHQILKNDEFDRCHAHTDRTGTASGKA